MSYDFVIRKENRLRLDALKEDYFSKKDPNFFKPFGTHIYTGKQGSGKTIGAVKHIIDVKRKYQKSILVSNLLIKPLMARPAGVLKLAGSGVGQDFNPSKDYIYFQTMDELSYLLTNINNGMYGVIYLIDEIHTYFNALDSKNIPMYVFTEISQQRKQRKLIIGTSQLFLRMAKPFREQCTSIITCKTSGGVLTRFTVYDGMDITQDYDGTLHGNVKRHGWFFQSRNIRNLYDTYQKVVSGAEQYDQVQSPITTKIKGKSIQISH